MAQINQDIYILGQSSTGTISGVGQEIALNLTLLPQPAVNTGTVTGTVTDGTNPIQGAYVKIMDSNYNPVAHTVTNSNGEFTFNSLTPGQTYYAYCSANGMLLTRSNLFSVSASTPTNLNTIALSPDPNASTSIIAGDLVDSITQQPINGAVVYLYQPDTNGAQILQAITYTNSFGQFVFRDLNCTTASITFTIRITALGYNATSVTIPLYGAGQIGFIPVIKMEQNGTTSNGTVSGMITDSNGIIIGADVILYSVNSTTNALTPQAFTQTDNHGVYLFFNVSPGTYVVKSNKMTTATVTVS